MTALEDSIRCKAVDATRDLRCELVRDHTGPHQHTNTVWHGGNCSAVADDGRLCMLMAQHPGDHNFGIKMPDTPEGMLALTADILSTQAVTIDGKFYPAWQAAIRKAQVDAHKAAEAKESEAAANQAERDRIKSEMIGDLLKRCGLPAGEQQGADRRLGDFVFSVDRGNYLGIWINPVNADPEVTAAINDSEFAYQDLSGKWGNVYGDGTSPYTFSYHGDPKIEAENLTGIQVWIADQFDRLTANYASRAEHAKRQPSEVKPARALSENDKIAKLVRELVLAVLEDEGVLY